MSTTGSVGELKEEKRGSVASRCRRAALTCLVRNSLVRFAPARSLADDRRRLATSLSPLPAGFFHLRQDFLTGFPSPFPQLPPLFPSFRPSSAPSRSPVLAYNFARVTRNSRVYFPFRPSIRLKNFQHLHRKGMASFPKIAFLATARSKTHPSRASVAMVLPRRRW